jgi:[ribosomal protein S18]-alanine N-acetyltransferase
LSTQLLNPQLEIRPMLEQDLHQVTALEYLVYPFPWTRRIIQDCLQMGYWCRVLTLEERLIGYGVMSVVIDESHILNICIHPKWQRHGLGTKLLKHLLELAHQQGAETLFLEVRAGNQAAITLYQKTGFEEIGRRRDYYPAKNNSREDALVLSLNLKKSVDRSILLADT